MVRIHIRSLGDWTTSLYELGQQHFQQHPEDKEVGGIGTTSTTTTTATATVTTTAAATDDDDDDRCGGDNYSDGSLSTC